ncbi:hypothetical protein GDO81_015029 [Engystomops pustulosus]|uniref:Uncharacterized protein n=3 Tax=Engystomops pustulosus TaxID=76066 RepID=A0AAV7AKM0_ENGPU|nr:hypothetical protein GDO81_015029 [Engystomops pustulosus]
MDAMYPGRYRYSPERIKKAMSVIDPMITQRTGRRQSEPSKHILKHLDGNEYASNMKHSGSEDGILDFGDLLHPAVGDDAQTEGVKERPAITNVIGGPQADLSASEDENEEEMHVEDNGKNTDSKQQDTLKGFKRQHSDSSGNAEKRRSIDVTAFSQQMFDEMEERNSEADDVYIAGMVNTSDTETPLATTDNESFGEEETYSGVSKPLVNGSVENAEDIKTFSSEEDEEETHVHESSSILPPSVLDQASVIAERFLNNLSRRSSLALEDGKVIGYITPRLLSRSSSLMNLDGTEKSLCQNGNSQAVLANCEKSSVESLLTKVNSVENVFDEKDRLLNKPRESTLSFQDRQLIDKIKTYYDKAEHQDAAFSIKRRESLSYIPAGAVKNSIFKMNTLPRYDNHLSSSMRQRTESSSIFGESRTRSTDVDPSTFVEKGGRGYSTLPKQLSGSSFKSEILEMQIPASEEEFKSPSEMIKVWEEIEKEKSKNTNHGFMGQPEKPSISVENPMDSHEPLIIIEDSDISSSKEDQSPTTDISSSEKLRSQSNSVSFEDQDYKTPNKEHPTLMELASFMDVNLSDNMKSRVYQLARQYSQRIKSNKPAPYRRLKEIEEDMRRGSLSPVTEEKSEEKCKLKTTLSLPMYDHIGSQEHSPTTPTSSLHSEKSPKRLSFNSAESPDPTSPLKLSDCRSPLSPVKTEKFHWPDVRELRSRYTKSAGTSKSLPVNRSLSVPDKMMENLAEAQNKESSGHSYRKHMTHSESMNGVSEAKNLFDKINLQSPNVTVSSEALHNGNQTIDDGYYISAEAPLDNNKKIIILEKLPTATACDVDDTYVHIRSPTTREKISIKAVIERCKAYQDSEEYKMREDLCNSESPTDATSDQPKPRVLATNDTAQQNRVKNLREKFQILNSKVGKDSEPS